MREYKAISPSAYFCWVDSREEFYLRYLAEGRTPPIPQANFMSIGSAFDARVKSYLYHAIHGHMGKSIEVTHYIVDSNNQLQPVVEERPEYSFGALFYRSVEPQNYQWAEEQSAWLFIKYRDSGALADLLLEIKLAAEAHFEFEVNNQVLNQLTLDSIPLKGKPDLYFKIGDTNISYDWKVNGYCSKSRISPKPQYLMLRNGHEDVDDRQHGKSHKDAYIQKHDCGLRINIAKPFEQIEEEWATQTTMYSWLMGTPVGEELIVGIEQSCGNPETLRFVSYRGRVSREFQFELFGKLAAMWRTIARGKEFIFADQGLSQSESLARCELLDNKHQAFTDPTFNNLVRSY